MSRAKKILEMTKLAAADIDNVNVSEYRKDLDFIKNFETSDIIFDDGNPPMPIRSNIISTAENVVQQRNHTGVSQQQLLYNDESILQYPKIIIHSNVILKNSDEKDTIPTDISVEKPVNVDIANSEKHNIWTLKNMVAYPDGIEDNNLSYDYNNLRNLPEKTNEMHFVQNGIIDLGRTLKEEEFEELFKCTEVVHDLKIVDETLGENLGEKKYVHVTVPSDDQEIVVLESHPKKTNEYEKGVIDGEIKKKTVTEEIKHEADIVEIQDKRNIGRLHEIAVDFRKDENEASAEENEKDPEVGKNQNEGDTEQDETRILLYTKKRRFA